jgi:transcription antitermination factor NusG
MSSIYMLYAKGGYELAVADQIRDMGVTVHCARQMEFLRKGKQRRPEPVTSAYLPNYIFAEIPADQYLSVMAIKELAGTAQLVIPQHLPAIKDFMAVTEAEYSTANAIKGNMTAMCEYKVGQALKCLDTGFQDAMLTFKGMVERSHDLFPKVQASMEMMGQVVQVEFDPLQVRAAE